MNAGNRAKVLRAFPHAHTDTILVLFPECVRELAGRAGIS